MATATITLDFSADPANVPTAITMTALTRTDAGAPVTFTAPWTDEGGNVWSNTFTAPAAGLTYAYAATAIINGGAAPFDGSFTDSDGEASGDYWSVSGIRAAAGTINSDTYAVNGISSYVDCGTLADNWINGAWSDAGETVPIASDDARYDRISAWANDWALAEMYFSRGMRDTQGGEANPDGVMSDRRKRAEMSLSAMIRNWRKLGAGPTAGASNLQLRERPYGYRPAIPTGAGWPDGLD